MSVLTKKTTRRKKRKGPIPGGNKQRLQSAAISNFRTNFALALEFDGRSLRGFARDMAMAAPHLSRIRSGAPYTASRKPLVPGLDVAAALAEALGFDLYQLLLPPERFLKHIRRREPGWEPSAKTRVKE